MMMKIPGILIRISRMDQSRKLTDLAFQCHISASYLSQIETGKAQPDPQILRQLAKALDLDYTIDQNWLLPARQRLDQFIRTALLSATRGTGISSSISAGYAPWAGAITIRQNGSMVSDRKGIATPYAMQRLQARGNFFVEPQSPVYEGQVVGVNNKPDELDVNITLAKHMTNMRSSTADVLETLTPPIKMSLEESLDFANEDECVEVTPESIRVRKIILGREDWYKWRAKQRRQNAAQQGK